MGFTVSNITGGAAVDHRDHLEPGRVQHADILLHQETAQHKVSPIPRLWEGGVSHVCKQNDEWRGQGNAVANRCSLCKITVREGMLAATPGRGGEQDKLGFNSSAYTFHPELNEAEALLQQWEQVPAMRL